MINYLQGYYFNIKITPKLTLFSAMCILGIETVMAQQVKTDSSTQPKSIEEVVIIGYGKQKRTNLTTAVSTIDGKVLENRSAPNIANMIQGSAPGLVVTRNSGRLSGQGLNLQIRGITSVNGNVSPMIVIDGIVSNTESFYGLNPEDIESISILKDGGATAIYGAASAGGVILVNTKRGKSGQTKISFSSSIAIQKAMNTPKRLKLVEEMEYMNLARTNSGLSPEYNDVDLDRAVNGPTFVLNPSNNRWITYNQQDFIKMTLRDSYSMIKNNLTISGGNNKLTYLASLGNMQQEGVFRVGEDFFSRWNARVNLSAKVNEFIKIDFVSAYIGQAIDNPVTGGQGLEGDGLSVLRQMYNSRLRYPIYDEFGRWYISGTSSYSGYAQLVDGGFDRDRKEYFSNSVTSTISNLVKGLEIRLIYGRDIDNKKNKNFRRTVEFWEGPNVKTLRNASNRYTVTWNQYIHENFQGIIDYDYNIDLHNFHIMGGYQVQKYDYENLSGNTSNLYVNDDPSLNFTSSQDNKNNGEIINSEITQSIFGRFNYDYASTYLFEFTLRSDESSRLTKGDRVKIFPSFSIGWNISRESWFEDLPISNFINELKPRASWAKVGSKTGIGFYDYISQLSTSTNIDIGGSRQLAIYPSRIPATNLEWETIETKNIGLDFSILNRKLYGTFEYFNKYNNNMFVPVSLPATIGMSTPMLNVGRLKVWGWEFSLGWRDKIGKDFRYNVSAILSDNKNRLINYTGTNNVVVSGVNGLIEGYSTNTIWVYKTDGYYQTVDDVANGPDYSRISNKPSVPAPGDVRYVDVNGDGQISVGANTLEDHGDLVHIGDTHPRYQFGINLDMSYKNFDFSLFIQGIGKRRFKPNNSMIQPTIRSWYLPMAHQMDYWTPENRNALFPRPFLEGEHNFLNSDKWFFNGAYARLKNIQLGYSITRKKLLKNTPLQRIRIYVSGEDLLTISKLPKALKGVIDPEQEQNTQARYPFSKSFSVGANIDF